MEERYGRVQRIWQGARRFSANVQLEVIFQLSFEQGLRRQ